MTGFWRSFLLILGGLFLAWNVAAVRSRPPRGSSAFVQIEPESNPNLQAGTRARAGTGVSGTGFVSIDGWDANSSDYGHRIAGETAYPFEVSVPGTYYCWVRALWAGTCANSITLAVVPRSGAAPTTLPERHDRFLVGNDVLFGQWHWVRGPVLDLQAGRQDLFMGTRESAAMIDCILLTLDHRFDPTAAALKAGASVDSLHRFEPFLESFTGSPDRWVLRESEWQVVRRSGLSAIGPLSARRSVAQARIPPMPSARMECGVQLTPGAWAGLFFGGTSADDYFVARLGGRLAGRDGGGRLQIGHQTGGGFQVLAEAPVPAGGPEQWELLTVWFGGNRCRVLLAKRPVLDCELPRDATGNVGLYADCSDPMLKSTEVPEQLVARPARHVGLDDFQPLADAGHEAWPGLILPLAGGQSLLLRWTNLAHGDAFARRVELVRKRGDGTVEVVGDRWGVFGPEARPSLKLDWTSGRVLASIEGSPFAACAARPVDDVGGLVAVGKPRGLFADFVVEPLSLVRSGEANPGASRQDERREGRRKLRLEPFSVGMLATCVESRGLPFAWVFDLDRNGVADTLGVALEASGARRVWFTMNGRTESRLTEAAGGTPASVVFQAYFGYGEILAFADGRPLIHENGPATTIEDIETVGGLADTRTTFTSLPPNTRFFSLGRGWSLARLGHRELNGDALVQVRASRLDPGPGKLRIQLHASRRSEGSGYELELEKAEPATWRFRRNGALIGEGKMPPGAPVNLELYQLGSVMRFDADARPVFRYRDPDPLRSGYVDVTGLTSSRGAPEPQVTLKQAWATACVFHQEINAVSSMGLWAARSGRWVLGEDAEQLQGYLLGQPTDRKTAVLEYRGPLDACDLLLELRVFRFLLRRGHRLSIAMEAEGSRSPDVVTVEWPDPAKPVCRLRRDQREISAVPAMDPTNPAPVLTVLRTRTQLSLYLDQVLVTRMERAAEGGIGKLWLELESPSGESLGIASICLQENPLAAPRISEGRMQLVSFQNALVRGHAEGSRR